jgi:hypothetical protein
MASSIYHAEMLKNIIANTNANTNANYEENYYSSSITSNLTNHIGQIFKSVSHDNSLIDMDCNINYKQLEKLSQNNDKSMN